MSMTTRLGIVWRGCWMVLVAIALAGLAGPATAHGQYSNQFGAPGVDRPTTSPYLNLFRSGQNGGFNDIGFNYQRLVRPEQQWRGYTTGLGTQMSAMQQQLNTPIGPDG